MGDTLNRLIEKYGHIPYKASLIVDAIEKAKRRESKLNKAALEVPSMTSLNIRHLLNNLGAISTNYLECGTHLGGHFCSVVYNNSHLKDATAIDNFSEFYKDGITQKECISNMQAFTPGGVETHLIEDDCFVVDYLKKDHFDLYNYDAQHTESSQQRAVSHFLQNLKEEFIMVVDDWSFPGVESGTRNGIKLSELDILFEEILITPDGEEYNEHWHNNFAVFYLRQNKNT